MALDRLIQYFGFDFVECGEIGIEHHLPASDDEDGVARLKESDSFSEGQSIFSSDPLVSWPERGLLLV